MMYVRTSERKPTTWYAGAVAALAGGGRKAPGHASRCTGGRRSGPCATRPERRSARQFRRPASRTSKPAGSWARCSRPRSPDDRHRHVRTPLTAQWLAPGPQPARHALSRTLVVLDALEPPLGPAPHPGFYAALAVHNGGICAPPPAQVTRLIERPVAPGDAWG